MYVMDGRQYVLVAAASTAAGRGAAPDTLPAAASMGWVAYALPGPR
jgi:hypothetical protein